MTCFEIGNLVITNNDPKGRVWKIAALAQNPSIPEIVLYMPSGETKVVREEDLIDLNTAITQYMKDRLGPDFRASLLDQLET